MKKLFFLLATALVAFSSCNTQEKVVYFQDIQNAEVVQAQAVENLKFQPGDRLTIVVTSSLTPEDAVGFNLPIVTMQAGAINGMNYSTFMNGLKKSGVVVNRKMLAELAVNDAAAFAALAAQAKKALNK